ncbi:Dot/Icm T4SS effector Lem24 [Legionella pneumophila]|uniref:Dot/Icm T4SS effector Lem24 n=1 Tax=Legionella pneumophila TaxID=446 RepID=UPI000875A94D|nr:Dot/Icm T4SS effector Lem24 [Legionella pneumophila]AOW59156.1 hypothetical protein BE843_13215 [Legionella pneumophila subsp. pneumophila]AOW60656.1 hypothetical protein BE844_05555 [Legionella pneumophila subsp. pneumophila]AOW66052.1 hypothetical protein BE846_03320 [Legionella pneumophila subsp. pneumophila]HEE0243442.1 Dot/Icm T4SS effector Lem24 [Legionella pneumophila]
MWIFKDITDRYYKKILDSYQLQADEKTYKGKEAELLIQRNELARCLIKTISLMEVKTQEDYANYFKRVSDEINSALQAAKNAVKEYNEEHNTDFTTDLYESFFTYSLSNFIEVVSDLFQKSPSIITNIMDESLFCNNRSVPWVYQLSFVFYDYILDKEFEFITTKSSRDIFDAKKQLVLKYIQKAADLYPRYEKEDFSDCHEMVNILLLSMRSEENNLQKRRNQDSSTSYMYSYFTQTLYNASGKLMGKGQLGQKIDLLIEEFNERVVNKTPLYT